MAAFSLSHLSEAQSLIRCSSLQSSTLQRRCRNELLSVSAEQVTQKQGGAALPAILTAEGSGDMLKHLFKHPVINAGETLLLTE